VHPDFSNNYDHPIPKKWPARTMRIVLKGRFGAGHGELGVGLVKTVTGTLKVVNGSHVCKTRMKLTGHATITELPPAIDDRYAGTITAG